MQAQQRWQEVSTNIPAFYKSYQDLSFLASALGANIPRNPSEGKIDDLNNQQPGSFCFAHPNSTQNMPSGASALDHTFYCFGCQAEQAALQIGGRDGNIFMRLKVYNIWGTWVKI